MMKIGEIKEWALENIEKVVFSVLIFLFLLILIFVVPEMLSVLRKSVNYFPYSQTLRDKKIYVDFDRLAALINEVKTPRDYLKYYKRDIFSEYIGEIQRAEEPKEEDKNAVGTKRFRLMKIFRQPVKLLFKGYILLPDGDYSIQINWGERTDFRKVGESIRGYKVLNFDQKIIKEAMKTGIVEEINKSTVEIQKGDEPPIKLEKGTLITEKELFAKLFDKRLLQSMVVYVGFEFEGYKILDINENEIVVSMQSGEVFHLKIE